MNELDIKKYIDKLIMEAENHLEKVYARMLKEVLADIQRMYNKYQVKGELSYTDLNKYNRLHSLFERITATLSDEYKTVVKELSQLQQTVYVETYLRQAYLFEVFQSLDMGFQIPTKSVIDVALLNPIEHLRLPKVLQEQRNHITRELQIMITQSLIRGDGYWSMAAEIEKKIGFSRTKARAVARTEAGRAMSIADEKATEHAGTYVKLDKIWCSTLDLRVRTAHRTMDGQKADDEGYFHYRRLMAKGPHQWNRANMDINCRCVTLKLVNGMLPAVRRGRNYKDKAYQEKLQEAVQRYIDNEGLTFAQAVTKATNRIQPPNEVVPYMTFNEWNAQKSA